MRINRAFSIVLAFLMLVTMLPSAVFADATGTVTITGQASFVSAPVGTYSKLAYTATYNSGVDGEEVVTDPAAFTWEVTKDGIAATDVWCRDGELVVSGGVTGTYVLTATHTATGIKSADFTITMKTANVLYKYSDNAASDGTLKAAGTKLNMYVSGGKDIRTGVKTVTFKFIVPADGTGNTKQYVTEERGWKESIKISAASDHFKIYRRADGGNTQITLKTSAGLGRQFSYDTWHKFSYVFDMDNLRYSIYVDDELCYFDNGATYTNYTSGLNTYDYYVYNDVCDATSFTGAEYSPSLVVEDVTKTIIIPQSESGKAYVQLNAESFIYGKQDIVWSMPATAGVSLDENTGLVTVTKGAQAGTIKVTATQHGMTDEVSFNLKVMNEDFESYNVGTVLPNPPWQNSNVASDGADNKYNYKTNGKDYIGWYFTNVKEVTQSGSMIIEFKFKGGVNICVRRNDTSDWSKDYAKLSSPSGWANAKLVYNNTKNANGKYTRTVFVNDVMVSHDEELAWSGTPDRIVANTTAIDDFKVYGVDFAAPEAHKLTLADVVPGSKLDLSYNYYNEGYVAENGTEITWAYADSKDSINWTALPEYNGKLSIDAAKTAQLDGKYVKAVVTPKAVNPYTNEVVAGTPVEKIVAVSNVVLSPYCTVAGEDFDIDNDTLAAGQMLSYTLAAKQIEENATTYMVIMAEYTADGKELLHADVKELTTQKGVVKEESVALEKEDGTMIKVFVWKKANLSPVIFKIVK